MCRYKRLIETITITITIEIKGKTIETITIKTPLNKNKILMKLGMTDDMIYFNLNINITSISQFAFIVCTFIYFVFLKNSFIISSMVRLLTSMFHFIVNLFFICQFWRRRNLKVIFINSFIPLLKMITFKQLFKIYHWFYTTFLIILINLTPFLPCLLFESIPKTTKHRFPNRLIILSLNKHLLNFIIQFQQINKIFKEFIF